MNTAQDPGMTREPPCRGARYCAGQELCPRQKRAETPGNFGGERPVRDGLTPVLAGERWNRIDEQGEVVDRNRGAKEGGDGPEPPKALRRPVPGQGASAPLAVPARPRPPLPRGSGPPPRPVRQCGSTAPPPVRASVHPEPGAPRQNCPAFPLASAADTAPVRRNTARRGTEALSSYPDLVLYSTR